jgi:hypothetical protein
VPATEYEPLEAVIVTHNENPLFCRALFYMLKIFLSCAPPFFFLFLRQ